jgi:hypothetical protein
VGDSVVIYNSYLFKNIQPTTIEGIGGYVLQQLRIMEM